MANEYVAEAFEDYSNMKINSKTIEINIVMTGDAEATAGFNIILHATNHALDKDFTGIENCLNYWKTKHPGIAILGINVDQAGQDDIFVFDKEGFRIAILNYTFESNNVLVSTGKEYCLNLFDQE